MPSARRRAAHGARSTRDTAQVDVDAVGRADRRRTRSRSSARRGNYGYGTIDDIAALGRLALDRGVGLHVDGCLGGFILPFGEQLGYAIPPFDFRVPGVTTISADTHKYGYGLKGTSLLLFRDRALRNSQYFFQTSVEWRQVLLAGHRRLALERAARRDVGGMVSLGREGYLSYAKADLRDVVRDAGRRRSRTPSCG